MTHKAILSVLALFMIGLIGCSEKSLEPSLNSSQLNLEDEWGGYTSALESPGFGDQNLLGEFDNNAEFNDPLLGTSEFDSMFADPQSGIYHLRIVWGNLHSDSTATEATDWSGSLTISRGGIVVRRLIHFEPDQDSILERSSHDLVEWVSTTTVHNDGIAVGLVVRPPRPIFDTTIVIEIDSMGNEIEVITVDTTFPEPEPVTVEFTTGPYSRTFTLGELQALDTIVTLEESNAVAFHAFRLNRVPCPHGFLAGHWAFGEDGEGTFRGVWMSRNGFVQGFLSGHFGVNDDEEKVFFGKWISRSGHFEGFVKGEWDAHPDFHATEMAFESAGGWFSGGVFTADGMKVGLLKGKFRSGRLDERGFFQGRWKLHCPRSSHDGDDSREGF